MEIIVAPRQTGKTTYLLARLEADPESVMIVHSYPERERLQREIYRELGSNEDYAKQVADRIVSIDHVISGRLRGRKVSEIHVDNLDLILPYMLGGKVGTVTTSEG